MFNNFTWRRGSGELDVIEKFADLARKASVEAGADVTVVLNFPGGYLSVVASTAENPVPQKRIWTPRALAKGLALLRQWLGGLKEGEDDGELREEIDRLRVIKN